MLPSDPHIIKKLEQLDEVFHAHSWLEYEADFSEFHMRKGGEKYVVGVPEFFVRTASVSDLEKFLVCMGQIDSKNHKASSSNSFKFTAEHSIDLTIHNLWSKEPEYNPHLSKEQNHQAKIDQMHKKILCENIGLIFDQAFPYPAPDAKSEILLTLNQMEAINLLISHADKGQEYDTRFKGVNGKDTILTIKDERATISFGHEVGRIVKDKDLLDRLTQAVSDLNMLTPFGMDDMLVCERHQLKTEDITKSFDLICRAHARANLTTQKQVQCNVI